MSVLRCVCSSVDLTHSPCYTRGVPALVCIDQCSVEELGVVP